jgi:hypothetical protein
MEIVTADIFSKRMWQLLIHYANILSKLCDNGWFWIFVIVVDSLCEYSV